MPRRRYGRRPVYRRPRKAPVATYDVPQTKFQRYAATAYKALSIATNVAAAVNSELKNYDEDNTTASVTSSGTVYSIVRGMAQGDTNNTINGNSVLLKAIQCRGTFSINASATSTVLRMIIFQDYRPQSSVPAVTDVLSAAGVSNYLNIDNQQGRFKVLYDRRWLLNSTDRAEGIFNFYRKCNFHVKFNDSQVPVKNDVLVLLISDEATNTPAHNTKSRLRFYDN